MVSPGYSQFPGVTQGTQPILRGTVINAVSGEPIPRALVQVYGYPAQAVLTDSEGRFEFQAPAGRVSIGARKPGFFGINETNPGSSRPQLVRVGPNTQPVVIKLLPAGVITGHVEDDNGEPVERAQIRVTSTVIVNGRKQRQPRSGTATNEDGDFRVGNLPPGAYYISVAPEQNPNLALAERSQGHAEGYPGIIYYPGVPDLASATPAQIAPGQRVQVDFSLKREPVFRVSGTVTGNLPGQFPGVQLVRGEEIFLPMRWDPRNGRFEAPSVPAGNYTLRANVQDNRGALMAELPLTVASDVSGIRLVLQPSLSIPINVRTEFSKASTAQMMASRPAEVPLVSVGLNSGSPLQGGARSSLEGPQENRTLAVRNVRPGRYVAEVNANGGGWYVESAECGDVDLLREPLVVAPGVPVPPIEIVLRDDTAKLTVRIQSEEHDRQAVLLVNESAPMQAPRQGGGGSGEMLLEGLAPGNYTVYVFDSLDGIEYTNPAVMSKYSSQAGHVSLSASGQGSVSVELIKTGE